MPITNLQEKYDDLWLKAERFVNIFGCTDRWEEVQEAYLELAKCLDESIQPTSRNFDPLYQGPMNRESDWPKLNLSTSQADDLRVMQAHQSGC